MILTLTLLTFKTKKISIVVFQLNLTVFGWSRRVSCDNKNFIGIFLCWLVFMATKLIFPLTSVVMEFSGFNAEKNNRIRMLILQLEIYWKHNVNGVVICVSSCLKADQGRLAPGQ